MLPSTRQLCLQLLRSLQISSHQSMRTYAQWRHRLPTKILNDSESSVESHKRSPRQWRLSSCTKKMQTETPQIIETGAKQLSFVTLRENDNRIMHLMTNIKSRRKREKSRQTILEGQRLILEGLKAGLVPNVIFFSRVSDVEHLELPEDTQLYKIPYRTIQLWSNLATSPGLVGIFTIPSTEMVKVSNDALPMTIICDNVREPGNLGSILRVAAGVGCERLILIKGCVDVWDPKVLRSAAGAHFRVPILMSQVWSDISSLISDDASIYIADNNTTFQTDVHLDPTKENSEGESSFRESEHNGKKEEQVSVYKNIKTSLKAAEDYDKNHLRSDIEHSTPLKTQVVSSDSSQNPDLPSQNPSEEHQNEDIQVNQEKKETKLKRLKAREVHNNFTSGIPVVPYYSIEYTQREVVLIVSGETEGLSLDSFNLLRKRGSVRVNVPLANDVESLNTGVALGVVAFEVKRQFLSRHSALIEESMSKAP